MTEIYRNAMDLLPKILTFAKGILAVLTMPFGELWASLNLPAWAEIILTPIAWLINNVLPNGGSILDMIFLFMIPVFIVWTLGKFFT